MPGKVIVTNNKDFAMACWECGYTVKYAGGREKVRQYIPYEELYEQASVIDRKVTKIGKTK